jgi:septal ring factor EnvC (AmiA/AmiB activator)
LNTVTDQPEQEKMSHPNKGSSALAPPPTPAHIYDENGPHADGEIKLLREENAALQAKVEELENLVIIASQEAEARWTDSQREFESLIEEKTEVIRSLHQKNADLREQSSNAGLDANGASAVEIADRPELIRLNKELQDQRRQIKEDEESMMGQMRQMEMSLAKDRAELARQRAEIARLQQELKHELEMAARDHGLRDRLGALQRRANNLNTAHPGPSQDTPPPSQIPKPPVSASPNISKSGLFRRIFGNSNS